MQRSYFDRDLFHNLVCADDKKKWFPLITADRIVAHKKGSVFATSRNSHAGKKSWCHGSARVGE